MSPSSPVNRFWQNKESSTTNAFAVFVVSSASQNNGYSASQGGAGVHGVIGCITYNACQAVPFHTNIVFDVVLKYNAPTINASPELSTVGAVAFAPK
jgi:hypothetical protein